MRVGIIVPRSNTVCEAEFQRQMPAGVSFHTARMRYLAGTATADPVGHYLEALVDPLFDLSQCVVDAVLINCTTVTMEVPAERLRELVARHLDVPLILASEAITDELRALQARKLVLFTPYTEASNVKIGRYMADHGIEVTVAHGLGLNASAQLFRQASRITPERILTELASKPVEGADTIFLSCSDMPAADAIPLVSERYGLPVTSTNQACLNAVKRLLGENK